MFDKAAPSVKLEFFASPTGEVAQAVDAEVKRLSDFLNARKGMDD